MASGRCVFGPEPHREFLPEPFVWPVLDLFVQRDLHVAAAARERAHRGQRETAFVVRIDDLVMAGRHFRHDAEPAEGIDALEMLADIAPEWICD